MIEAMAHGTPVIAWNKGAMPEIVDDGVSGFVVDTVEEAVRRVPQAIALDRQVVRARFEERFGADRMIDAYLAVYAELATADLKEQATAREAPPERVPQT